MNTTELAKRLSQVEEPLKKTRDNEEMGWDVVKKETEIKWVRMELTKAQAFMR